MKILGTLFRFVCALLVLLAVTIYLSGSLQVSLTEYISAFAPEHLQALAKLDSWFAVSAGALLLLTLCGGMKLGWNIVYSLATIVFFIEAAAMLLEPQLVLPTPLRALGWEACVSGFTTAYPVATLMVPCLCILGCLCSNAPFRIALTSLICCALCYGLAELLNLGVQQWAAMPEPALPDVLTFIQSYPWTLAALPAVFLLQYCLFMAMFEAFIPRKKKKKDDDKKTEKAAEATQPAEDADKKKPAATSTVSVAATTVVVKRPVIHKKSPISTPAEEKKEPKAQTPAEEKKDDAPKADAPAEEKKDEAPKADAPAEEKKEDAPKADAPAEEKKEDEDELPSAPIPSVPLPPTTDAAS